MGSKKVEGDLLLAARPPKARTLVGESFSTANFSSALILQHCQECAAVNYPPRERCSACLSDSLRWCPTDTVGEIVSCTQINVSQWEFFKRKVKHAPWPIASVKLADQILFTHLAVNTFSQLAKNSETQSQVNCDLLAKGTKVNVFTQSDSAKKSVLITVSDSTDISTADRRKQIAVEMGITE